MMLHEPREVVLTAFFIGVSLFLYVLLGGGDFGAGILERFVPQPMRRDWQEMTGKAMGPVWEANHIWLIVAVVLLFAGFPMAFDQMVRFFHLPLLLLLLGIVGRGCAFVFRHYDVVKDRSQLYYTGVFVGSSTLTPFVLGILVGSVMVRPVRTFAVGYVSSYVMSWCSPFAFVMGGFMVALFAYVAAVYLLAENQHSLWRTWLIRAVFVSQVVSVVMGGGVFAVAWFQQISPLVAMWHSTWGWICLVSATLLGSVLWVVIRHRGVWTLRLLVGAQLACIFAGWVVLQYPVLVFSQEGTWTLSNSAAPRPVLRALLSVLLLGSCLVLPALAYLFRVFKRAEKSSFDKEGV